MKYFVYFLKSQKDNKYYIGCTSKEITIRVSEHNRGCVKSTKFRRPLILIYYESFTDKNQAFKRKYYLKTPQGYQDKLKIIRRIAPKGPLWG